MCVCVYRMMAAICAPPVTGQRSLAACQLVRPVNQSVDGLFLSMVQDMVTGGMIRTVGGVMVVTCDMSANHASPHAVTTLHQPLCSCANVSSRRSVRQATSALTGVSSGQTPISH